MSTSDSCSQHDLQEARVLQARLRQLFDSVQPGAQESPLKEVHRLCDRALLAVDDEYCQQQICEVERHAVRLFSAGGVMFQRRLILDTLGTIRDRLAVLEALGSVAPARVAMFLEKT